VLPFDISVRIRRHPGGAVTLTTLEGVDLAAWGIDEEALREDLELALTDRLERSHPSLLHRFHAPRGRERRVLEVPDALLLAGTDGMDRQPLPVEVVVEPDLAHLRVRLPAFAASLWIDASSDVSHAVEELVRRLLEDASLSERLTFRSGAGAALETLTLEVEPASPLAFTAEHAGAAMLPEPAPEKTVAEKEAEQRVPTPLLDRIALEMTGPGAGLSGAIGRDEAVDDLLRMLAHPGAVVVVVGPPTSGKTAVIEEVAKRLGDRRGWYIDANRLVSADLIGWRKQTVMAAAELAEAEGVWFIGDPLPLLDAGKHVGSDMNVAQVLKPYLSGGRNRVLGECSEEAWGRLEARDLGFARLFTPYRLHEPAPERTEAILQELGPTLPVPVDAVGVEAAMELAHRYGRVDARLGHAAQFLRRLAAEARSRGLSGPLSRRDVLARFCAETGMPEVLVRDDLPLDPAAVAEAFQRSLVGQPEAVELLVDLVAVIKGGMSDLDRPLGGFLFVGPTGVGKTEAAKALARWLFGGGTGAPARLLRFDMSEYAGPDCIARLLDPTAGLVAAVRRRPFAVVLLDEIEKAHPAVFDLLLQVLGEARLSDANGHTADFRNTVILMTSNLGVGTFRRPTGFGGDPAHALREHVLAEVAAHFRPEFFNRLDRVVPFRSLHADAIDRIATREVDAVARRPGLQERGIHLLVDPEATAWIAARGVDPAFGARPLKRAVHDHLVAPLARHLAGGSHRGTVRVEVAGEALGFRNTAAEAEEVALGQLQALMKRLSDQRWLAGRWAASRRAREARQEVALVDRLMTSKRFWTDQTAATERSTLLQPVRDAVQALTAAQEGIAAVEDLVHEAYVARDLGDLDALVQAADDATAALTAATLALMGSALPNPDRIRLVFYQVEDEPDFRRSLVASYLDLCVAEGWTVVANGTEWPDGGLTQQKFLKRAFAGRQSLDVELEIEGRHAATLLMGESGGHLLKHPSTPVKVPVAAVLSGPSPSDPPVSRFRIHDPGRKQLQDVATKVTTTLHAQRDRSIRRMIGLRLLIAALGERDGVAVWRGTRD
jgi:ATP-dependent Clp protease ATP-binding subunit ClpA